MLNQVITYFVKKLVDAPQVVTVDEIEVDNKNIIAIKVAPHDLPKVIGKEGRTFKALRSLIRAIDPQSQKDITVDSISQ